jgi:hypothetical protein
MQVAAERSRFSFQLRARLDAVIARPLPLLCAIFLVFLFVYGASIFLIPKRYGRLILGDGIYYFVYLRSAVFDHDLEFTNDYTLYQQFNTEDPLKKEEMLTRKTPMGMAGNFFSIGPAVLWSPIFLVTYALAWLVGRVGDGFSYWYEAPLMFASIAYGFLGIVLTYRVVAGMFSKFAAFVSILGIWLATNVVYYMGVSPSASHVLSMFASALFLFLWWRGSPARRGNATFRRTRRDWFVWGLSAGLMALVRWQDILIALLALFEWVAERGNRSRFQTTNHERQTAFVFGLSAFVNGLVFLLGALLAFLPQMLAWNVLYGSPFTIPQGYGFLGFWQPEMLNVWFSTKRGLFTWTPLLALAVIGFVPLYRINKMLGTATFVVFILETYVTSIVVDWWGGEAFGARRFISLMPFFALGLAAFIDFIRPRISPNAILIALGAFVLWNNLFVLQYNLWLHGIGHISALPTWQEITIDKFTAPFRALETLRSK